MRAIFRRFATTLLILLLILLPLWTGAFPENWGITWIFVILVLIVGSLRLLFRSKALGPFLDRLSVAGIVFSLSIVGLDTVARFANAETYQTATYYWPEVSHLTRYQTNGSTDFQRRGDLLPQNHLDEELETPYSITFTSDDYGFRNDHVPDLVRLVVLSDSYGIGAVSQDENWASMLAQKGYGPVYNLSVAAIGPWQEWANFAIEARRIEFAPDAKLIWMIFSGNDLYDTPYLPIYRYEDLSFNSSWEQSLIRFRTFRNQSVIGSTIEKVVRIRQSANDVRAYHLSDGSQLLVYQPYLEHSTDTIEEIYDHPNYPLLIETISAMKQTAEDHGVQLFVVLAPSKPEVYQWLISDGDISGLGKALDQAAQEIGICFYDLTPDFVDAAQQQYQTDHTLLWWRDDTHWNVAGNQVAADLITDWLDLGNC